MLFVCIFSSAEFEGAGAARTETSSGTFTMLVQARTPQAAMTKCARRIREERRLGTAFGRHAALEVYSEGIVAVKKLPARGAILGLRHALPSANGVAAVIWRPSDGSRGLPFLQWYPDDASAEADAKGDEHDWAPFLTFKARRRTRRATGAVARR